MKDFCINIALSALVILAASAGIAYFTGANALHLAGYAMIPTTAFFAWVAYELRD